MMRIVLDSSVLAKLYFAETDSPAAIKLLQRPRYRRRSTRSAVG